LTEEGGGKVEKRRWSVNVLWPVLPAAYLIGWGVLTERVLVDRSDLGFGGPLRSRDWIGGPLLGLCALAGILLSVVSEEILRTESDEIHFLRTLRAVRHSRQFWLAVVSAPAVLFAVLALVGDVQLTPFYLFAAVQNGFFWRATAGLVMPERRAGPARHESPEHGRRLGAGASDDKRNGAA
jgi:hypothetical protein